MLTHAHAGAQGENRRRQALIRPRRPGFAPSRPPAPTKVGIHTEQTVDPTGAQLFMALGPHFEYNGRTMNPKFWFYRISLGSRIGPACEGPSYTLPRPTQRIDRAAFWYTGPGGEEGLLTWAPFYSIHRKLSRDAHLTWAPPSTNAPPHRFCVVAVSRRLFRALDIDALRLAAATLSDRRLRGDRMHGRHDSLATPESTEDRARPRVDTAIIRSGLRNVYQSRIFAKLSQDTLPSLGPSPHPACVTSLLYRRLSQCQYHSQCQYIVLL